MRLIKARVQNYRSVLDSGEFELEKLKTILVGPNEAGKTVILKALQQLNQPDDVSEFDALRDYPRSKYNDIKSKKVNPKDVPVVTGYFELDDSDKEHIPQKFHKCKYKLVKYLNNRYTHQLVDVTPQKYSKDIKKDMIRLCSHMDKQFALEPANDGEDKPSESYQELSGSWSDYSIIKGKTFKKWLEKNYVHIKEGNTTEENRFSKIESVIQDNETYDEVLKVLNEKTPVFILFNNYFKVKPNIHLRHLVMRVEQGILDDSTYDYGNLCLLKLLGFTANELADIGDTPSPDINDKKGIQKYRDILDSRSYQLNAASVRLTKEIRSVWLPNLERSEADKLKLVVDGQYLKVVVEDDLGVDIELDQRSEGFQWLVSFFIIFFSEAMDKHENSILLLDEPGMSLHALKQRDFQKTISRLSEGNQTIFTTHSPFLVGPNELDLVRVVEMKTREDGSKVHTTLSSEDPASMLPLQESLGYDLAHSLFSQQRNLVLEGITDYWYIESMSNLLNESGHSVLNNKIALVFANSAGKVVYYATILHAHKLKVAALLDSDAAGDQAATQENLVHTLGNKNILRTKDFCSIKKAEIEDLLRETLIKIIKNEFDEDVSSIAFQQPDRPIIELFSNEVKGFSKYKLAKAFVRWTRDNKAGALTQQEIEQWKLLIEKINKTLK